MESLERRETPSSTSPAQIAATGIMQDIRRMLRSRGASVSSKITGSPKARRFHRKERPLGRRFSPNIQQTPVCLGFERLIPGEKSAQWLRRSKSAVKSAATRQPPRSPSTFGLGKTRTPDLLRNPLKKNMVAEGGFEPPTKGL